MRSMQWISRSLLMYALAFVTSAARADHGTYLPSASFFTGGTTPTARIDSWGFTDATTPVFNANVVYNGVTEGTINFNYDTFTGTTLPPATFPATPAVSLAGAGLSGGFNIGQNVGVIAGFSLAWVQVVLPGTTIAGQNAWNAANGSGFPDTQDTTSPIYPFQTVAVGANPTVGFVDFPFRYPSQGNQTWRAELGLVALNNSTHQIRPVESFIWGFDVTKSPEGVSMSPPQQWSPVNDTFDNILITSFNGTKGTLWTMQDVPSVYPIFTMITPEPGCLNILLLTALPVLSRRPRRGAALAVAT